MNRVFFKIIIAFISISFITGIQSRFVFAEQSNDSVLETQEPVQESRPGDWPMGPNIQSLSGIVMDFESGAIVYDKASQDAHYPASITKIMTALLALENCSLDEVVTFSHDAVYNLEPGSSSIARDEGERMTMEECLYGLMLESANECANAIAEHIAGSNEAFAEMMNKRAISLGCVNTHFVNPHGLHDDNHYTCAYDMALIARAAYQNPTFTLITATKTYTIPPTNKHEEPTLLNNHHNMLHYFSTRRYLYDNCVGGKTGYTSKALSTLVTYAREKDSTLICVTMCGDRDAHYEDTRGLLDYYFANMEQVKISDITGLMSNVSQKEISALSFGDTPFELDTTSTLYLPKGYNSANISLNYKPSSITDGDTIGIIDFDYLGKSIGSVKINSYYIDMYPFRNIATTDGEKDYIKINILKVLFLFFVSFVAIIIIIVLFIRVNSMVTVVRRRKFERRDPHKNMRRIKRRRDKRRRREG